MYSRCARSEYRDAGIVLVGNAFALPGGLGKLKE